MLEAPKKLVILATHLHSDHVDMIDKLGKFDERTRKARPPEDVEQVYSGTEITHSATNLVFRRGDTLFYIDCGRYVPQKEKPQLMRLVDPSKLESVRIISGPVTSNYANLPQAVQKLKERFPALQVDLEPIARGEEKTLAVGEGAKVSIKAFKSSHVKGADVFSIKMKDKRGEWNIAHFSELGDRFARLLISSARKERNGAELDEEEKQAIDMLNDASRAKHLIVDGTNILRPAEETPRPRKEVAVEVSGFLEKLASRQLSALHFVMPSTIKAVASAQKAAPVLGEGAKVVVYAGRDSLAKVAEQYSRADEQKKSGWSFSGEAGVWSLSKGGKTIHGTSDLVALGRALYKKNPPKDMKEALNRLRQDGLVIMTSGGFDFYHKGRELLPYLGISGNTAIIDQGRPRFEGLRGELLRGVKELRFSLPVRGGSPENAKVKLRAGFHRVWESGHINGDLVLDLLDAIEQRARENGNTVGRLNLKPGWVSQILGPYGETISRDAFRSFASRHIPLDYYSGKKNRQPFLGAIEYAENVLRDYAEGKKVNPDNFERVVKLVEFVKKQVQRAPSFPDSKSALVSVLSKRVEKLKGKEVPPLERFLRTLENAYVGLNHEGKARVRVLLANAPSLVEVARSKDIPRKARQRVFETAQKFPVFELNAGEQKVYSFSLGVPASRKLRTIVLQEES